MEGILKYLFIRCDMASDLGLHYKLKTVSLMLRVYKVFYGIHLLDVIRHLLSLLFLTFSQYI